MKHKLLKHLVSLLIFTSGLFVGKLLYPETETKSPEVITSTDELLGITSNIDLYYPITVVVTEVGANGQVTAVDRHGEIWHFESEDAWVGDLYSCIVSDNANGLVTVRFAGELSEYKTQTVESKYTLYGRYYTNGTFVDTNGEVWNYQTDFVDDKPVYNGMPICVGVSSNGTQTLSDDVIQWCMLDYVTQMKDRWN